MLSVIIPAYNEEGSIGTTIDALKKVLIAEDVQHEILIINDNSTDNTLDELIRLNKLYDNVRFETNKGPNGFGYAIRFGLDRFRGKYVAIMMADMSDDPVDLIKFYRTIIDKNVDCVYGSRFIKGGSTHDYPTLKLYLNRLFNNLIRLIFNIKYNDITNAFKLYKAETIQGLRPFLSPHFNLTVELPLKAIIRGYSYEVVPNSWHNRKTGESKLKIREMGSRYFFILMYCLIEKYFSKEDYKKPK